MASSRGIKGPVVEVFNILTGGKDISVHPAAVQQPIKNCLRRGCRRRINLARLSSDTPDEKLPVAVNGKGYYCSVDCARQARQWTEPEQSATVAVA